MNDSADRLGNRSAGFALSATTVALFNTALACVKDAYHPLNSLMNRIAGHNWTAQAVCDLALFVVLGLLFSRKPFSARFEGRLPALLVGSVILAGVVLFSWYAWY